ncbi:MAG TPA: RES family NAD+ phosphorylase [Gammaproteobacteria bacterium]
MSFKSWRAFREFEHHVKTEFRFSLNPESKEFLAELARTSSSREKLIKKGSFLWRAQLGHGWHTEDHGELELEVPGPYSAERMKPVLRRAKEGRVNPKGIPFLYLSTDRDTAMSETRPWMGETVSVAQFEVNNDIEVIDFSQDAEIKSILEWYFEEPDEDVREQSIWAQINHAFSTPITVSDNSADYVVTQLIAEVFRAKGFKGIAYRSSLGEGTNVALFDLSSADPVNCFLYEARDIRFEFSEAANPWFLAKS